MANKIPESGSSYGYVSKVFGEKLGFLVGWIILLDYLFLPIVIWLIGGVYLEAYAPGVPSGFWLIAFIVLTTGLNIIGFDVAKKVNLVLMGLQLAVIIAFCALAVVMLSEPAPANIAPAVTSNPFNVDLMFTGAAIACYSFLGFDAVSTMAEDARTPKANVPKAILFVTIIDGLIFAIASYIMGAAFPDISVFLTDSAAADMATQVGGITFSSMFVATLVVAQFTSGVSAQAGASRLIYAMGRDGVLPSRTFGRLHSTFKTPYAGIACISKLLISLGIKAITLGLVWLTIGVVLMLVLVKRGAKLGLDIE